MNEFPCYLGRSAEHFQGSRSITKREKRSQSPLSRRARLTITMRRTQEGPFSSSSFLRISFPSKAKRSLSLSFSMLVPCPSLSLSTLLRSLVPWAPLLPSYPLPSYGSFLIMAWLSLSLPLALSPCLSLSTDNKPSFSSPPPPCACSQSPHEH